MLDLSIVFSFHVYHFGSSSMFQVQLSPNRCAEGDDNNSGSPPFIIALVLVVAAAFSLRSSAMFEQSDHPFFFWGKSHTKWWIFP
jgi:hypothetical protein